MRIVGYHAEDGIIANSDGEYCTEQPFVDFLLEPKPESIKVFFHMGYSVANILKMLGITKEEAKKLQDKGELLAEPYLIKHRASKFLSIKKGHYFTSPFANFGDMNQYKPVDFPMIMERPAHTGQPLPIEWCFHTAKEAQRVGEEVYGALINIGLHPTALTSPVNAYFKEVLSKAQLPTIDDIPEEAGYYAYQCCQGNWLEAFKLGHWDVAYDYDINSAYPYELTKLLDIRLGKWLKSDHWIQEAEYGFCKGIVTINKPFSPVIYSPEAKEGDFELNYTPTGTWERFMTKRKVEEICLYNRGNFQLIDGWWWIPTEKRKVLFSLIHQLWNQKENSKGIARDVTKRVMSGMWGMFLQVNKEGFGDLFNPVYGAEVEANTRISVMQFVINNRIDPIHISVDGVLSPDKVAIIEEERLMSNGGHNMGRWELSSAAPTICAGTAAVAVKGRQRTADFSIDYDWLVEQIKQNPEATEYKMSKLSPITLAVALNDNWEHLGELRTITKTVYVGEDPKRYYKEKPRSGRELLSRQYDSVPWDVSLLSSSVQ